MPQWRKLHGKIKDSLDLNEMPDDFHRLLWTWLPLALDSQGRGIDDASWIRSNLFPLRRDVTYEMIEQVMTWLAQKGMLERYQVNGRCYFHVPTFAEYQGNTEREAASKIPAPVKRSKQTRSRPTHDQITTNSRSDADADAEEMQVGADAPSAPDPVKELAAVFEELSGIKLDDIPKSSRGPTYWNPLQEMVKMANGKAQVLLRSTVQKMRSNSWNISSPKSCMKTFTGLHGEGRAGPASAAGSELRRLGYVDADGNPV